MEAVLERVSTWANQTYAERQETIVSLRRFLLASMESGNPSAARTVLREVQAMDLQAWYSLRAEIVGAYGMDV